MNNIEKKQATYCTHIAMACDTSKMHYKPDIGQVDILPGATIPPRLARYAEQNGHAMPDGLYGFFGEQATNNLKAEVLGHLKGRVKGDGFLWDLKAALEFRKKPTTTPVATSLIWRDPSYLEGAFIRVGKASKEVADLLRYFTGDKYALDRLTLEPWRIDSYAAALEEAYGSIRAMVFDAMMDDGSIVCMVRVFDPSLITEEGISPLYEFLSAKDPEQPTVYCPPADTWPGWGGKDGSITAIDRADIMAFQSVPRERRKEREALSMRRIRFLRQEARFQPREADIKELVNRRLEGTRATNTTQAYKHRKDNEGKDTPPTSKNDAMTG